MGRVAESRPRQTYRCAAPLLQKSTAVADLNEVLATAARGASDPLA